MRALLVSALILIFLAGISASAGTNPSEQEIVDRYMKMTKDKQITKVSWLSAHFEVNRINRHNDYNAFATNESAKFTGTSIPWLGEVKSFGLNTGLVFRERFAWSIGGEYWLKHGVNESGTYTYNAGGLAVEVDDFKSEISVWGISTGLQYYPFNHPTPTESLQKLSFRIGGSVGYYHASWSLWSAYQSINLSTSETEAENIAFTGSAPGFAAVMGLDYPLGWNGFAIGMETSYLHLNLGNVAWYNSNDEEIVATYNGTTDGRVDLNLSGVRARIEIKRFFSW